LLQSLLNEVLQWFISFLTKHCKTKCEIIKERPHSILKKGPRFGPTPCSPT